MNFSYRIQSLIMVQEIAEKDQVISSSCCSTFDVEVVETSLATCHVG